MVYTVIQPQAKETVRISSHDFMWTSILKLINSVSGGEATFTCGVVSGFRSGASVLIVEVTTKGNEVRHQQMNLTATKLEIPEGAESHVRKFVCEMWFEQRVLSKSEVAELNIIKQGKIIKNWYGRVNLSLPRKILESEEKWWLLMPNRRILHRKVNLMVKTEFKRKITSFLYLFFVLFFCGKGWRWVLSKISDYHPRIFHRESPLPPTKSGV